MRKQIIAGNWKMNNDLKQSLELVEKLNGLIPQNNKAEIIVAPAFTNLYPVVQALKKSPIKIAAQNIHQSERGAYTGEVSANMIQSLGVNTVILGHSERRTYFKETNELLSEKVSQALSYNLRIIFCVGELLNERKEGKHFEVMESQISKGLFHLSSEKFKNIVLAYEPVWAIGTGETASPEQAQEAHAYIRGVLASKYGKETAESTSILYGGSCKPNNAKEIFSKPDVDGGLIGGAALKADDFYELTQLL